MSEIFKELRKNSSLRRFAKELQENGINITYSYLAKIEKGDRCPSVEILRQISKKFNLTMSDLIDARKNLLKAISMKNEHKVINKTHSRSPIVHE
jgi:transcriptional regulator with XRE-family HTH domain